MRRGVDLLARSLRAAAPASRKVRAALVLATNCCIEDVRSSFALGTPRWVSPSLMRANVLTGIQPEGIILADLLLEKLGV